MAFGISAAAWAAGAAVVGTAASVIGSNRAVNAQKDAANQADATTRESMAMQERLAAQSRADNEPWRQAGQTALGQLAAAPDFSFNGANVAADPGYQFGLAEGNRGLTNSAAARGGLLSGAALKASTRYAQDYAGTKFNEAYGRALQTDTANKNRLQSLAGIGQTAVGVNNSISGQLGNQLAQGSQSIAQNQLGVGNARASGYLAAGNTLTSGLNQGVSAWNNYNRLSSFTPNTDGYGPVSRSTDYSDNAQLYGV